MRRSPFSRNMQSHVVSANLRIDIAPYRPLFEERATVGIFLAHLFLESEKRRCGEDERGLVLGACKLTLAFLKPRLVSIHSGIASRSYWTKSEYENLAEQYAKYVAASSYYKAAAELWLRNARKRVLTDEPYCIDVEDVPYLLEEAPMKTFKRVLDRIDYLKASEKAFRKKDKVTALFRAGKATLPEPHEWQSRLLEREIV